ncbi:MAG: response regulator [Chitinophagales bacterium]
MKLIFTYDTDELKGFGKIVTTAGEDVSESHVLTDNEHLYDVAVKIKKEIVDQDDAIIFIPQFLDCEDEEFKWLQNNAGIALIKFLRMLEVRQHIVLITPYAKLQLIEENPGNLIVSSKGVSFMSYLHEVKDISLEKLKELAKKTFDEKQDLKPYLLAEFRLPEDERHNWANWWGVVQLVDVHRHIFPQEISFNSSQPYPAKINDHLKQLKSRQALYLYNRVNIDKSLAQQIVRFYERQLKAWDYQIDSLSTRIQGFGKKEPSSADWKDYISYVNKVIEDYPTFNQWEREKLPSLKELYNARFTAQEQIENGKKILAELKDKSTELGEYIRNYSFRTIESTKDDFKDIIIKLRSISTENVKPRILHIDDQAQQGWAEIFQLIIYGKKQEEKTFSVWSNMENKNEELSMDILGKINDFKPDLVLLDLRLKNEGGVQTKVEELSGAKVLQSIKQEFPGLPVMITTASNKVWSYRSLQRLGADAYWSKEGLDIAGNLNNEQRNDFSTGNYLDFIECIHNLCGQKYGLLKKFGEFKKGFEKKVFWWESGRWTYPQQDKIDNIKINGNRKKEQHKKFLKNLRGGAQTGTKSNIQNILNEVYFLLFSYLQHSMMGNGFYEEEEEWFYPSLIIQQLGKCLEIIHGFESLAAMKVKPTIKVLYEREDKLGKSLYRKRGDASHINKAKNLQYDNVKEFINNMVKYFDNLPIYNQNQKIREDV